MADTRTQEPGPREDPQQDDWNEIPPGAWAVGRVRGEAFKMLKDDITVEPGRVAHRHQDVPRRRDDEEQKRASRQVEGSQAFPLIEDQQPDEHDGAGHQKAHESLGQCGERGAGVESVEQPAPARGPGIGSGRGRRLAHAEKEAEECDAHEHRDRHVEDQEAPEREVEQRGAQHQRGGQSGGAAVDLARGGVGGQNAGEREQHRDRAS